MKDRTGQPAVNSALKRLLNVLRGVFIRAETKWGVALNNPLRSIKGLSVHDSRERVITDDEWRRITLELQQHEQGTQDAIAFARHTAARCSEVVKLDWSDIDLPQKTARLRETKSRTNKVVDRVLPLPAIAIAIAIATAIKKRSRHVGQQ